MLLLNPEENLILENIFLANFKNINEPQVRKFRAENFEHKESIERLVCEQLIKEKDRGYRLTLNGFAALSSEIEPFKLVKLQCQEIFTILKHHYKAFYGDPITIGEISEQISVDKEKLLSALYYVSETSDLVNGRSTNLCADDAHLYPYENILEHESFEQALDKYRGWIKERLEGKQKFNGDISFGQYELIQERTFLGEDLDIEYLAASKNKKIFVDRKRIEELKELNLEPLKYDLSKTIQICHEMNNTYSSESYYALAALQRMLIDHVPPLFGFKSFSEVTSQCGSKSFQKHMVHLDKSLRNISDSFLHQQVRKSESLPNEVTINFSSAIDELLAEISRSNTIR